MEAAATFRSFDFSAGSVSRILSVPERLGTAAWPTPARSYGQAVDVRKLNSSTRRARVLVASAKTSGATVSSKSDVPQNGSPKVTKEKHVLQSATFPDAFQTLLTEVCDESSVAELKLKVGSFEMHVKRKIEDANAPAAINSPVVAPPIPSEPMNQSGIAEPSPSPPKSSPDKSIPFLKASTVKSLKLSALEASGFGGFKLVSSPAVGSFCRGRTVKGKKLPPVCKEGDLIKEGQIIGFVDQFGTQLPVKSDVAGELSKVLFDEGEAVGYGDPLVAVLPSFHPTS